MIKFQDTLYSGYPRDGQELYVTDNSLVSIPEKNQNVFNLGLGSKLKRPYGLQYFWEIGKAFHRNVQYYLHIGNRTTDNVMLDIGGYTMTNENNTSESKDNSQKEFNLIDTSVFINRSSLIEMKRETALRLVKKLGKNNHVLAIVQMELDFNISKNLKNLTLAEILAKVKIRIGMDLSYWVAKVRKMYQDIYDDPLMLPFLKKWAKVKKCQIEDITNETINRCDWLILAEAMYLANKYKIPVNLFTFDRDFTIFEQEIDKLGVTVRNCEYPNSFIRWFGGARSA